MARHVPGAPVGRAPAPLATDLRQRVERALASLYLVYQPIVSWRGGNRILGYEALARCRESGLTNPAVLFDTAAQLGLARDLGHRVRILAHAALAEMPADRLLFLNLHPAELQDSRLYARDALLAPDASRVVFELTEAWPTCGLERALARLGTRGYRLALDDLGAGHNGLTALAATHPHFAKLDVPLVRGCHRDERRQRVIGSLLALCHDFDVTAVCEGVETAAELATLIRLGARHFQGYYFGRPAAWRRGAWREAGA